MHPFLEWPGLLAFAHRGGASDNPENTLPAFRHAVEMGYTYLETDVHTTADGVLVAFHDPDLSRTCGRPGLIHELQWAEVRTARVHGQEPIPLFDDVISEFPDCRFSIDCKADSSVDALVAAFRKHNLFDRAMIGTFSDRRTRRLRQQLGDRLCVSSGPVETLWWRATGRLPQAAVASVPVRSHRVEIVTQASVERSHKHGNPVIVWTVDEPAAIERLLDLGVDGIMTDRPAVLKQICQRRGVWV